MAPLPSAASLPFDHAGSFGFSEDAPVLPGNNRP
jgi:hypothetical protein